jgi:hypothetical protein
MPDGDDAVKLTQEEEWLLDICGYETEEFWADWNDNHCWR